MSTAIFTILGIMLFIIFISITSSIGVLFLLFHVIDSIEKWKGR